MREPKGCEVWRTTEGQEDLKLRLWLTVGPPHRASAGL